MMTLRERIYTALQELHVMQGDIKHVEICMLRVDTRRHKELIQGYREVWRNTYESEPNAILKANAARRAANLWILERTEETTSEKTTTTRV